MNHKNSTDWKKFLLEQEERRLIKWHVDNVTWLSKEVCCAPLYSWAVEGSLPPQNRKDSSVNSTQMRSILLKRKHLLRGYPVSGGHPNHILPLKNIQQSTLMVLLLFFKINSRIFFLELKSSPDSVHYFHSSQGTNLTVGRKAHTFHFQQCY